MKTHASLAKATHDEICRVRRDNFDYGNFSIMSDGGTVWLSEQKLGKPATQSFEIPRHLFNKLIRSYLHPQKFLRKP